MAEHTKRDKLAADAEAKAGKKHRGLRMTVAGDRDEAKTNPRSLLKKVRKVLLDASPVLRKNPSVLVTKGYTIHFPLPSPPPLPVPWARGSR